MNIGIISHSPAWTSGFGTTCNKIAHSLSNAGHTVTCFCVGEFAEIIEVDSDDYPFKIWKPGLERSNLINSVGKFLEIINPDVVVINYDIAATAQFIKFCKVSNWNKKIFAHIAIDGFPAYGHVITTVKGLSGIIVPTKASQKYLRSQGLQKVWYAPHGVNQAEFTPLNKDDIKLKLGIKKKINKDFIIGVFAKNEERKQLQKVFLALRHLVFNLKQKNIWLYVHSQTKPEINKGWDLEHLANHLNLTRHIIFTDKNFRQDEGVERLANSTDNPNRLSYIERINMCDIIVNIPLSGGFELCNIEAQSCGVPVITVNDDGNIKEVVGDSAILLKPALKTIWGSGAWINMIDEIELANQILEIRNNPYMSEQFRQKGFENINRFPWKKLENAVQKLVIS
jgi:glycosyltransferase involved in cell wall biosynthesis